MELLRLAIKMQERQNEFAALREQVMLRQIAKQTKEKRRVVPELQQWLGLTLIKVGQRLYREPASTTFECSEG